MKSYDHPSYLSSLAEFGIPRALPESGGWLLERKISGFPYVDCMGPYPLFCCEDWSRLPQDIMQLDSDLVAVTVVTDPFANFDLEEMAACFYSRFFVFKLHYAIDLEIPLEEIGGKRRRRHARRALNKLSIEVSESPAEFIDDWMEVYSVLVQKHQINGIRAFSRQAFLEQFKIPGSIMIRALYQGKTIGAQVYLYQGEVIHAHLGACDSIGYDLEATYAIDYFSFEFFKGKAKWLNLGGGIGISNGILDGLSQYKSAWASHIRNSYFCGRIINVDRYEELVQNKNAHQENYFPAYRAGEF
jgi:hypothetical protein